MGDPDAPPLKASELFASFEFHAVRYVLVGGLAATVHGAGRVTYDIDVVPEWSTGNLERLSQALRASGARLHPRGTEEPPEFTIDPSTLRRFEVSTWRTRLGDVDVIIGIPTARRGRLARYAQLARRAHRREVFGITIQVADLDDVIVSKEVLGRESDLVALPELQRLRERLLARAAPPDAVGRSGPSA